MKKISSFGLAFSFTGCFLGAGFVSGQELWQFFGAFGKKGVLCVPLAALLLATLGIIVILLGQKLATGDMDKLVIVKNNSVMRGIFAFFEIFFLFGVNVVMTAAAGALAVQMFGINSVIMSIAFALLASLIALAGAKGLTAAFSVTVPLLTIMTIIIFCINAGRGGLSELSFGIVQSSNPLLSNPVLSACVFVSYNFFAAIGVLAPLGGIIKKRSCVFTGIFIGAAMLTAIAFSILITIISMPSTLGEKLPMLAAASKLGNVYGYIFAVLLILGMSGASFSSVYAITEYAKTKSNNTKKTGVITVIVVSVLSVTGSLIGFSNLVSIVYPIFGYLGFIAITLLIINFCKTKNKTNTEEVQCKQQ